MSKSIIMCIDSSDEILTKLEDKISRIIDSNYIVYTYKTAEEALMHSFENIANGNNILMTISSYSFSTKADERFLIDFYKHSPYTKNILFSDNLNTQIIANIINESSIYRIIPKELDLYDFELMILDTIKVFDQERRLREYQNILEDAVDKRTRELKDINIRLQVLATTDSLTGIKNRRSFFDSSKSMVPYCKREGKSLGFLMIDIDHFKSINDTYGHSTGDEALKLIARTLNTIVRKSDILGRIGGEEFAVALPNTQEEGVLLVANKIRLAIENLFFTTGDNKQIDLRVSVGVSMLKHSDEDIDDIRNRADMALYKAKELGRNQVQII